MNGRLTEAQRAHLLSMGAKEYDLGRMFNRAGAPGRAQRVELPSGLTVPDSPEQLADFVSNPDNVRQVMADPNVWFSFMASYGERAQGEGTELRRTISEVAQETMINYLRENELPGIRRINLDPQSTPVSTFRTARDLVLNHNPAAPGAPLDRDFANSGEFFKTIHWANRSPEAQRKRDEMLNAYGSVVPADGGFLIPEVLRASLLQVAMETAVVRPRAFNVPMEALRIDFPMIDATTNVGSIMGGMIAYWIEEGATMTESSARFGSIRLEAKNLTGFAQVPNQLLADSIISFSAFIETAWPKAISWFEDIAFLTGSGVGEPLGAIGAQNPAAVVVSKESGQAASTILWENVVNMFSRMFPQSINSAIWLAAPDTFPQLATMALSVGTGGAPVWLNNGVTGPPAAILGRPVQFTEKVPKLGTRGDLNFTDLSYYLVGDRQAMSAMSSEHFAFDRNKTAFRIIERVDGTPWLQSAITPANTGPTLSAFVELETRA